MHRVLEIDGQQLNCEECGWVRLTMKRGRPKCSVARDRERYPLGSTHVDKDGYRVVMTEAGRVREHRLVMAEILGRPLRPNEEGHHRNGNRLDNRPENLELWVISQPTGQRPHELVAWAREIIELYG